MNTLYAEHPVKSPNADGLSHTSIVSVTTPSTILRTSVPRPDVTYTSLSLLTAIAVGPSPTGILVTVIVASLLVATIVTSLL